MFKDEIEYYRAVLERLEAGKRGQIGGLQIGEVGEDGRWKVDQTQQYTGFFRGMLDCLKRLRHIRD
jgi:hypothetical protein